MSFPQSAANGLRRRLRGTPLGRYLSADARRRLLAGAAFSFLCNLAYALYYGVLGYLGRSVWFAAMCAYYAILSTLRFAAVLCGRKGAAALRAQHFVLRLSGVLLALLSAVLSGVNYLSLSQHIATRYHKIIMISIATYTFGKITMAAVQAVRERGDASPLPAILRSIRYAEVAASVLTLQRSMLVSFGTMDPQSAQLLNAVTGGFVSVFVFLLGVSLLMRDGKKSKRKGQLIWQNPKS